MSEIDSRSFLLDYVNIHCWSITVYFLLLLLLLIISFKGTNSYACDSSDINKVS